MYRYIIGYHIWSTYRSRFVQHRKSAIHGLPIKSGKSDWLGIWNKYSAHAQKIGSGQRPELSIPAAGQNDRGLWGWDWSSQSSRFPPQVRMIVGSGDENVFNWYPFPSRRLDTNLIFAARFIYFCLYQFQSFSQQFSYSCRSFFK